MRAAPPDRGTILAAVMPDLLAVGAVEDDPGETQGTIGTIVAEGDGVLAGQPVAAEYLRPDSASAVGVSWTMARRSRGPRPWPRWAARSPRSARPPRPP